MAVKIDYSAILGYQTLKEFERSKNPLGKYMDYESGIYAEDIAGEETFIVKGIAKNSRLMYNPKNPFTEILFFFEVTVMKPNGGTEKVLVRFVADNYEKNKHVAWLLYNKKTAKITARCGPPEIGRALSGRRQKEYPGYLLVIDKEE